MSLGDAARQAKKEELGLKVIEFYNQCNDPETGRFCEGPDGPGRVRDNMKRVEKTLPKNAPQWMKNLLSRKQGAAAAKEKEKAVKVSQELDKSDAPQYMKDKLREKAGLAKAETTTKPKPKAAPAPAKETALDRQRPTAIKNINKKIKQIESDLENASTLVSESERRLSKAKTPAERKRLADEVRTAKQIENEYMDDLVRQHQIRESWQNA